MHPVNRIVVGLWIALGAALGSAEKGPAGDLDTSMLPAPVFDEKPGFEELYWKSWELAWDHVHTDDGAVVSPFMDEGRTEGVVNLWETCFMALFTKYAPDVFPGIQSLGNFYGPMHEGAESSQEIEYPGNPPLAAWAEWEHFRMTGDTARLREIVKQKEYLRKHYQWFKAQYFRSPRFYKWSGPLSGMTNTPRGALPRIPLMPGDSVGHEHLFWVDAYAQQCLSALMIARCAEVVGEEEVAAEYTAVYEAIKKNLNDWYFRGHFTANNCGYYSDLNEHNSNVRVDVRTPASYWPMLAMVPDSDRAYHMSWALRQDQYLGGPVPFPSVARNELFFDPTGRYWRGSVFVPPAYMGIKALENYDYGPLGDSLAYRLVDHIYQTYRSYEPASIWEAYSPTEPKPATGIDGKTLVKRDYCGWSALGPISLFIENILGFLDIDAPARVVQWRLHWSSRHGIRRLRFADITTDLVYEDGTITVVSDKAYTLVVNGSEHEIEAGTTSIEARPRSVVKPQPVPNPSMSPGTGVRFEAEDAPMMAGCIEGGQVCNCSENLSVGLCNFGSSVGFFVPKGNRVGVRLKGGSTVYAERVEIYVNCRHVDNITIPIGDLGWKYRVIEDVPLTEETNFLKISRDKHVWIPVIDYIEVDTSESSPIEPRTAGSSRVSGGAGIVLGQRAGRLELRLASGRKLSVTVVDMAGRCVVTKAERYYQSGTHAVAFPRALRRRRGVYCVRVRGEKGSATAKIAVVGW